MITRHVSRLKITRAVKVRGKKEKNVQQIEKYFFLFSSGGVYANPDDDCQWPILDQVKTPKVKIFRNLSQQDAFLIVDFEKKKEEYRGRTIENLYLTLREKGRERFALYL